MPYNSEIHHRHSIRLPKYDYSNSGAYFITICAQNRECLFGKIVAGNMILNEAGKMIQSVWNEMPQFYYGIEIDAFQIMPNHIHGIIIIKNKFKLFVGAGPRACPNINSGPRACPIGQPQNITGQPQGVAPTGTAMSLCDVVHRFKTLTTKKYIDSVKNNYWPPFYNKLWQRNYYEHIIRNEKSLNYIQEYILNNPYNWEQDKLFFS